MTKQSHSPQEASHGSVRSYTIGFIISLVLTIAAYTLTATHRSGGWTLIYVLAALAISQLMVQLVFFLHLGHESKPRWNITALLFAALVVGILVFGSLWIMTNLNYAHEHLPTNETNQQIVNDEGYGAAAR